jgi:peptidoglycan/xylan/chitin deacetylase (PgdA/CDA1 family)
VALTFDDGPYPENTDKILEILREYDIKATFFMIGEEIKRHKETLAKVIKEGHEIGNHFFRHIPIKALTYRELKMEIMEWKKVVDETISSDNFPRLLRPPRGQLDLKILWYAWKYGWTIVLWSLDTRDLDGLSLRENIKMINSVTLKPGDIILLHEDAKYAEGLLEWIIQNAMKRGLTFCKVSELT